MQTLFSKFKWFTQIKNIYLTFKTPSSIRRNNEKESLCVSSVQWVWSKPLLVIYSVQQSSSFACYHPTYWPQMCCQPVLPLLGLHVRGITTEPPQPPPHPRPQPTGLILRCSISVGMSAGLICFLQLRPHLKQQHRTQEMTTSPLYDTPDVPTLKK